MSTFTFLLVIGSALLHASWNLVAKRHAGNYSIIYLSFFVSSIATGALSVPHLSTIVVNTHLLALLIATGVLHAVYGFVLTFAYKHGDISTVYPIVRGSGIAGAVMLSLLILQEHLNSSSGLGVILVISGIGMLSYRRNRKATSLKGILLALACGAFIMSYTIIDKLLVGQMHPIPVLAASQIISVLIFLPYVARHRRAEMKEAVKAKWPPVLLISTIATGSYLIILYAMQQAPVSRIVAVREASVVFGAIAGYILFKEDFSWLRFAGVALVLTGMILAKL